MNETVTAIQALNGTFAVLLYTRRIAYSRVGDSLTYKTSLKDHDGTTIAVVIDSGFNDEMDPVPFIADKLAQLAIDRDFRD